MSVVIPDEILDAARMTPGELLLELAALLYAREKLTMGQAFRLAGVDRLRFQHFLASRGIHLHYDVSDLASDLAALDQVIPE